MEVGQRAVGNLNPPPDRRFDVQQRDLELVERCRRGLGRLLAIARYRFGQADDSFFKTIHQVFNDEQGGHLLRGLTGP